MSQSFETRFSKTLDLIAEHNNTTWIIGYSGGIDSTVLLYFCKQYIEQSSLDIQLKALHVDHQLSPLHRDWVEHCKTFCHEIGVELLLETVSVASSGKGVEDAARRARYQAFEKYLNKESILLLGHHANDQTETLLFRLFRGTGISGLKGIPFSRELTHTKLYRPLLDFTRDSIQHYCVRNNLSFIDDPSNEDNQYARNFIRNNIIPLLLENWPSLHQNINRFASHSAQAELLANDMAKIDLLTLQQQTPYGDSLLISQLMILDVHRRVNVLRYWLQQKGLRNLSAFQTEELLAFVENNTTGKQLLFNEHQLFCYRNSLYYWLDDKTDKVNPVWLTTENNDENTTTKNIRLSCWLIETELMHSVDENAGQYLLADNTYSIKPIEQCSGFNDEIMMLKVNGKRKTLKKLFQEFGVPAWCRDSYPLVFNEERCVAITGLVIDDEYQTRQGWQFKVALDPAS